MASRSLPAPIDLEQFIANLRSRSLIPIGVLSFDAENRKFSLGLLRDVDMDEANALLEILNLTVERK